MAADLLQMSKFGDTGAESLKTRIDGIFSKKGVFEIKHVKKLVSLTSDVSVNTGQYSGLMTCMRKDRRDWLVDIHCVNHRVELPMKDGFDSSGFNEIDKLHTGIYNLCKHSRAIKTDIREAAETLNISVYSLTRLTGTCFIPHRRRALTRFLAM